MFNDQNISEKKLEKNIVNDETGKFIAPFADIYTSKEGYHILLDIPGVLKENLKIQVEKDELVVTGKISNGDKNVKQLYNEIFYDGYHRHFILPDDVDTDKIEANYDNGVLSLTLNKKEEFKPKLIEIK